MRVFIFALLGVFVVFCFLGEVGGIAGSQMANRSTDLRADLVETNSANKYNSSLLQRAADYARALPTWLQARAECHTIEVKSGDSCASLATECGILGADFTKYNSGDDVCSSLSPGQPVCCSSGTLPDVKPKQGADGICATYKTRKGDYCQMIASKNGLKVTELEKMNTKTWGWAGCKNLDVGMNICLSSGKPPMPASVSNAVCGPTKPGTKPPTGDKDLADLNPCPLKVCCNKWGQCGTTEDFCIVSESETGNPGTSANGTNGCISNCGMDVVNNDEKPASFAKVGYFEGWNLDRECLQMDVRRIDKSYTHVHFSFAEIASDFQVSIDPKIKPQFDAFKALSGPKRVLAFGGWSFSTEHDTYPIFRQSVTSANRASFAQRVVQFATENHLDGLDFDWEYPGAPDIPGIPPGSKDDGKNYLEFLKLIRAEMPDGMTLSVAAPASYWYLKGFPFEDMAPVLDYIIYMTYDIHGQWDHGNDWAQPGCPSGDCLRSHVNYTETYNSLAMITKAGVPAKKVVVGVASYGRSFKMADEGCTGEMCRFLGSGTSSPAKKGRCTKTSGYISNAEIFEIGDAGGAVKSWKDKTDTNYLVYDNTEWVAYMDDKTKGNRINKYQNLNFGGSSDWAVDLQEFLPNGGQNPSDGGDGSDGNGSNEDGDGDGSEGDGSNGDGSNGDGSDGNGLDDGDDSEPSGDVYIDPSVWKDDSDHDIYCIPPCIYILPPLTLEKSTTITFPLYTTSLEVGWYTTKLQTLKNGDVSTSKGYTRTTQTTTLTIPPLTTDQIEVWNVKISSASDTKSTEVISVTSSILPPPFIITNDRNPKSEEGVAHPIQTRTITPLPYPYSTSKPGPGPGPGPLQFPPLVHHFGLPRNPCKRGCGHKCLVFCDAPCLLNCPHPPPGFQDPGDPVSGGSEPGDPENDDNDNSSSCTEQSTVTDYWVSCNTEGDSSSCTTTSSSLATGCDVTATTTTTNDACPLPTADGDLNQGEDGGPPSAGGGGNGGGGSEGGDGGNPPPEPTGEPEPEPTEDPEPEPTEEPDPKPTEDPDPKPTEEPEPDPPKEPEPDPEPEPEPSPAPITQIFNIGYRTTCSASGLGGGTGSTCTSRWNVFAVPAGSNYRPCDDDPLWLDRKPFTEANNPDYGDMGLLGGVGPWSSGEATNCYWRAEGKGDGGEVSCSENGAPIRCLREEGGKENCDALEDWFGQGVCEWRDE